MTKNWKIFLLVVISIFIVLSFYSKQKKNHQASTVKNLSMETRSKIFLSPNNEISSDINTKKLERIMSNEIKEPAATNIWKWLETYGFEHPDSLTMLNDLFMVNGVKKYYKELISVLSEMNLDDRTRGFIIKIVTSSFDGGFGTGNELSTPANEKDRAIQKLILEELTYPKGKESFLEALEATYYLAKDDEVQEILNGLLELNDPNINKIDIYKQKVKLVSLNKSSNNMLPILQEIISLNTNDKEKIIKEMFTEDYVYAVIRNEDRILTDTYRALLKQYPPKPLKKFNENKFYREIEKDFLFPDDIITDEQRQEYAKKTIPRLYEEEKAKDSQYHEEYRNWIFAYGKTLNKEKRYNFYKQKLLDSNSEERDEILNVIEEQAMESDEYKKYLNTFKNDADLKGVIYP